jgi:hypothetical protein
MICNICQQSKLNLCDTGGGFSDIRGQAVGWCAAFAASLKADKPRASRFARTAAHEWTEVLTMTDLIRLEDALSVCSAYCPDDDGSCSKAGHDLREMLDELEALPTVDAKPVRYGRWIEETEPDENGNVIAVCNQCYHTDEHCKNIKIPYCWNCGADMREDMKCDEGD